ncbi:MAG: phosphatidate cytidylyltransferase [Steroidobacteraceae bacterium]|jgi:phosphatidate cytidylyltransferase
MLKLRILTALILGCVLLTGLFMLEPRWTILAFGVVWLAGAWEWAAFGGVHSLPLRLLYCCAIALLSALAWQWTEEPAHLLMLLGAACAWWVAAFLWLLVAPEWHRPRLTLLCGIPVLVSSFVALGRMILAGRGPVGGPMIVLWLVLLVIAADIGAFFVGRRFGRRKLAPRVSPGKTWEGAVGGLCTVALVAWVGARSFGFPAALSIGFGCAVGVFSVIGDLTESMFKRAAGLKDSGVILPGHGGILDRIDSVTAAAPLYALSLFGSGVIA